MRATNACDEMQIRPPLPHFCSVGLSLEEREKGWCRSRSPRGFETDFRRLVRPSCVVSKFLRRSVPQIFRLLTEMSIQYTASDGSNANCRVFVSISPYWNRYLLRHLGSLHLLSLQFFNRAIRTQKNLDKDGKYEIDLFVKEGKIWAVSCAFLASVVLKSCDPNRHHRVVALSPASHLCHGYTI